MSTEWNAIFAKSFHPYRDRHWLWEVFPELFPLPPGRAVDECKSQIYACGVCGNAVALKDFNCCSHVPKYSSAIDLTRDNLRGVSVQFAEFEEPAVKVFDAGCGTGASSFPLLEKNTHAIITAVDFSENAVSQLKDRPYYDASRITASVADILKLRPDPQFDFVMANFVLSSIADVEGALKALIALLKPTGTMLLLDYEADDYRIKRRDASECEFGRLCEREDGTILIGFDVTRLKEFLQSLGLHVYEASFWNKEERNRKTGQRFTRRHFIIKAGFW